MSRTYKKWTQTELEFISNNSGKMKDEELAAYLNKIGDGQDVTVGMVRRQRRKLSIVKPRGRRPSVRSPESSETV